MLAFRIVTSAILLTFVLVCLIWKKPRTGGGKLALKLCLINVVFWVIVLPLPIKGDPPPMIVIGGILWLLNLPLMIAIIAALWVTFREGEENFGYLTSAAIFVALNIIFLLIVPLIGLISLM